VKLGVEGSVSATYHSCCVTSRTRSRRVLFWNAGPHSFVVRRTSAVAVSPSAVTDVTVNSYARSYCDHSSTIVCSSCCVRSRGCIVSGYPVTSSALVATICCCITSYTALSRCWKPRVLVSARTREQFRSGHRRQAGGETVTSCSVERPDRVPHPASSRNSACTSKMVTTGSSGLASSKSNATGLFWTVCSSKLINNSCTSKIVNSSSPSTSS